MTDFPLATWRGRDGSRLQIRAIRPDDAPALAGLFAGLDPLARRRRFHGAVNGLSPQRLRELARAPSHVDTVLVATATQDGRETLVAEARCVADARGSAAEFALVVAAAWRREGIARRCLQALRHAAADHGLHWLYGHVLADNGPMLALLSRCGFSVSPHRGDASLVVAEAHCEAAAPTAPRRPHRHLRIFHAFTR
ncbi:GNAT family N-acetyltransferase [Variovorax sp. YR752]|uniref:GNAT family N-acetyltransferase n=1 Tax=Variovorax sp. YR752 TaxID=1884383 RepID=UPI0031383472